MTEWEGVTWGFRKKSVIVTITQNFNGVVVAPLLIEICTAAINSKSQFINFLCNGKGKYASGPFI